MENCIFLKPSLEKSVNLSNISNAAGAESEVKFDMFGLSAGLN